MKFDQKFFLITVIIFVFFLMAISCGDGGGSGGSGGRGGGGGGGDDSGDRSATGTIEGVVEGTIILSVVNDEIVAREDTSGRIPDIDKDGDGNNESFSFALTGIPIDSDVRIYLVENGGIFPLYYDSDGDGTPDTNVFSLRSTTVVNLGLVDINAEGHDGRAIPENNPAGTPNVLPKVEDTDIPESLNQPDTSGSTFQMSQPTPNVFRK